MCVAYPGTVIELRENGKRALVDFSGTRTEVQTGFLPVKEKDRVLVHAGYVLQVLKQEDADAMDEIFAQIEAMEQESPLSRGDGDKVPRDEGGEQGVWK